MLWIQSMHSESHSNINNCSNARLFSDVMKFTLVNESLSKQSRNVLFWRKINWISGHLPWLFSCLCVVCYSYMFHFECFLIIHSGCMCGLHVFVFFSIVLEYFLMGLLLCPRPTDQLPCLCYSYGVWSVIVVMVTLSFYCPMGPLFAIFILNCYSRPYWNRSISSWNIMVHIIFICL